MLPIHHLPFPELIGLLPPTRTQVLPLPKASGESFDTRVGPFWVPSIDVAHGSASVPVWAGSVGSLFSAGADLALFRSPGGLERATEVTVREILS